MTTRPKVKINVPPPLPEQHAIAAYLDTATAVIDNARRQSERMREYRASLIMHVVTDKLDVRAVAQQIRRETRQA